MSYIGTLNKTYFLNEEDGEVFDTWMKEPERRKKKAQEIERELPNPQTVTQKVKKFWHTNPELETVKEIVKLPYWLAKGAVNSAKEFGRGLKGEGYELDEAGANFQRSRTSTRHANYQKNKVALRNQLTGNGQALQRKAPLVQQQPQTAVGKAQQQMGQSPVQNGIVPLRQRIAQARGSAQTFDVGNKNQASQQQAQSTPQQDVKGHDMNRVRKRAAAALPQQQQPQQRLDTDSIRRELVGNLKTDTGTEQTDSQSNRGLMYRAGELVTKAKNAMYAGTINGIGQTVKGVKAFNDARRQAKMDPEPLRQDYSPKQSQMSHQYDGGPAKRTLSQKLLHGALGLVSKDHREANRLYKRQSHAYNLAMKRQQRQQRIQDLTNRMWQGQA